MFSKKAEQPPRKGGGAALMDQMGLGSDFSQMENMLYGDVENDEELEAELLALQGGHAAPAPQPRARPAAHNNRPVDLSNVNRMVEESIREIGDEDLSDTEDPDLLAELQGLSSADENHEPPIKQASPARPSGGSMLEVLEQRLQMYQTAIAAAKSGGDSSKAKRLERGVKTIQDLLKKARSGRAVSEDDTPPPVSASSAKSSPDHIAPGPGPPVYEPTTTYQPTTTTTSPSSHVSQDPPPAEAAPPMSAEDAQKHTMLCGRRDDYKRAALAAKKSGDEDTARKYLRTFKQFESVISALEEGKPVDLSKMPPPPGAKVSTPSPPIRREGMQKADSPEEEVVINVPPMDEDAKKKLFKAPESAGSTAEALQQRLEKYQESSAQAKQEGNNSKARRMDRIVKQYQDSIKAHKAGKPVDFDDLPAPPGFPPIPTPASTPKKAAPAPAPAASASLAPSPGSVNHQFSPSASSPPPGSHQGRPVHSPTQKVSPGSLQRQTSLLSRSEQQTMFLQERQLAFKKAALIAKQKGEIELAKKYLRMAKGFDQMIDASQSGLPVDMSQVPAIPGSTKPERLEFIHDNQPTGDRDEMYKKLEQDLINQIRTCTTNADHFTRLGDVSSAAKFDKMCQNSRRDLDALKNAYKHGDPVPRFHYESKSFSLVQCCTELGDNDCEIVIVRGLNYNLPSGYSPKDLDTYVKFEFPYPSDGPQKGESDTKKDTDSPEYNQSFKLNINRKSRAFLRLLQNKSIKFEVFYKRGFFKGDKILGSVGVKLKPLENQCVVHECIDLMDGRKTVGGKLEVKVRVRDPFISKQVEEVKESWLFIDHFERKLPPVQPKKPVQQKPVVTNNLLEMPPPAIEFTSMEVLKYEKQLLDQQIRRYEGKLTRHEEDALYHKSKLLGNQVEQTREQLKKGGVAALRAYCDAIDRSKQQYVQEAKILVSQGNRDKAQVLMTKKKLVEREVEAIRSKLPA